MGRFDEEYRIELDIDRDRIRTVISEAYNICHDLLVVDFDVSPEAFVSRIEPFLSSNRVSIPIPLDLPSKKYPELKIEVNIRKSGVFARMRSRKMQALLNHHLGAL